MNFNVYIDDETAKRLDALARKRGKPRNALVREALSALLDTQPARAWPDSVRAFQGLEEMVPFESHREALAAPADDPFGGPP